MTDPEKFTTTDELQAMADCLDCTDLRLAADFRIDKWARYTEENCRTQDSILMRMQARGEVHYVEDAFAVYFISGSIQDAIQRLEEALEDLAA